MRNTRCPSPFGCNTRCQSLPVATLIANSVGNLVKVSNTMMKLVVKLWSAKCVTPVPILVRDWQAHDARGRGGLDRPDDQSW